MGQITASQHYAPAPCPAAAGMELVERWRRHLNKFEEDLTQTQTEIDRDIYGFKKMETHFKEDASNKIEKALGHMSDAKEEIEKALKALKREMNRLQPGE